MPDIEYLQYRFVQSVTYPNRYYCREIDTTIARQGEAETIRPWCAWRGQKLTANSEWFTLPDGHQRTFKTVGACVRAVVNEWSLKP